MTSLLCLLAIAPLGKIMAIFFKRLKSEYIITCIIGSALQCYVCNSRIDEGCSGMPDPKYLRNCSELSDTKKYILCRKIDQEVPPAEGREYTQIKSIDKSNIRECGWEEALADCYQKHKYGGLQNVCSCRTDGCNGSPGNRAKIFNGTGLFLLSLAVIFKLS